MSAEAALHPLSVSVFVVCNSTMHHSCHHLSFMPEGSMSGPSVSAHICLFTQVEGSHIHGGTGFGLDSWLEENPTRPQLKCLPLNLLWLAPLLILTSPARDCWLHKVQVRLPESAAANRLEAAGRGSRWGRMAAPSSPLPPPFSRATFQPLTPESLTSLGSVCCIFSGRSKQQDFNNSSFYSLWVIHLQFYQLCSPKAMADRYVALKEMFKNVPVTAPTPPARPPDCPQRGWYWVTAWHDAARGSAPSDYDAVGPLSLQSEMFCCWSSFLVVCLFIYLFNFLSRFMTRPKHSRAGNVVVFAVETTETKRKRFKWL